MTNQNPALCPFEFLEDPKEPKHITETTDLTIKLLDKRYPSSKVLRGVHPKSHGCVKATFTINSNIDKALQVGLFNNPGHVFNAFIRFSNASSLVEPDINEEGDHGSRGMAIKVLDVGGEVFLDDKRAHNQDFLMINQPMFAFASSRDYLRLNRILLKNNDEANSFFTPLGLFRSDISAAQKKAIEQYIAAEKLSQEDIKRISDTFEIVQQIQATAVANPVNTQYFSAAPFLFGSDRVMKFSAKPRAQQIPNKLPKKPGDDYLRDAMGKTMAKNKDIFFDFMVQVRSEGDDLGIENASSLWPEDDFPFIKVAEICISAPQKEIHSAENLEHCENLVFTPWHSLLEHQPIGSINRLRKSVYHASAQHRQTDSLETDQIPDLPFIVKLLEKIFKPLFG